MTISSQEHISLEYQDGVVRLQINRPEKRNALNLETFLELEQMFTKISKDRDVRVVVLTGSHGVFSAGGEIPRPQPGDIVAPPPDTGTGLYRMQQVVGAAMLALRRMPQPIIAAVDGFAVGAGMAIVLACDLAIATHNSIFSLPFVSLGLGLDCGSSWTLPRLVGLRKASELALLGDQISAQEAATIGIINKVVDAPKLEEALGHWVERLAISSPTAVALIKQSLEYGSTSSFAEALDREAASQVISSRSKETKQ